MTRLLWHRHWGPRLARWGGGAPAGACFLKQDTSAQAGVCPGVPVPQKSEMERSIRSDCRHAQALAPVKEQVVVHVAFRARAQKRKPSRMPRRSSAGNKGRVMSAEGGHATSDVVTEKLRKAGAEQLTH